MQGRSGHGKSMLAQRFLDRLLQGGEAAVMAGKCYERNSVANMALDSLLDALSRYLRRLPAHEAQALLPREEHLLARVLSVLQRVVAVAQWPGHAVEVVDPKNCAATPPEHCANCSPGSETVSPWCCSSMIRSGATWTARCNWPSCYDASEPAPMRPS